MESTISRTEHEEFSKRIEEEYNRQNARLKILEEQTKTITDLTISVKELAISVKQMAETQREQGSKLERLEGRDGEMWRKVLGYIAITIAGIVIGFLFKQIGM